jgi:hypothetical protein
VLVDASWYLSSDWLHQGLNEIPILPLLRERLLRTQVVTSSFRKRCGISFIATSIHPNQSSNSYEKGYPALRTDWFLIGSDLSLISGELVVGPQERTHFESYERSQRQA